MSSAALARQRVVVVTGGGGGIGGAVAEELGRTGHYVVTVDPLVTLDGAEQLPPPEETTAGRIVAAGGSARASSTSVTDGDAIRRLFSDLVDEFGALDAVVNVAGITRPTSFTRGSAEDWRTVLAVHLEGYLNILGAALPIMAGQGHGHILGVTSGSGWRAADTGAYGCAKRAVASLTWQLGQVVPRGVIVNAMSPIAATRMVTAALGRVRSSGGSGSTSPASGGLSLASMPEPEELGPTGAYLVSEDFTWCHGRVIFAGGSEVAVIDRPRLLEAVRTGTVTTLDHVFDTVTAGALASAESTQGTSGGSNPRFGSLFVTAETAGGPAASGVQRCAIVSNGLAVAEAVTGCLEAAGVQCAPVDEADTAGVGDFGTAAAALASAIERHGPLDAVVVAQRGNGSAPEGGSRWERVLAEHDGITSGIYADAAWTRAVADYAVAADRPVRLVTLTDATTAGGLTRAQAAAQHARPSRQATKDRVTAFAVSVETTDAADRQVSSELAGNLVCSADAVALSGAELVVGPGWFGLRSHPHATGSITFGGPSIPAWLDGALREIVGASRDEETP
jgi:NAD(P)-dependent dehydrogenase (short-subunit alcohol dehydrogenase family)